MEKPLEKCLDELSHSAGVSGVLCADSQGLCLGVRGKASSTSSGMISALADRAAMLEPGSPPPVILLETDNSQCLIHRNSGVTLAVYKSPETS
ncbi:ragulator complex protein LAMTOR5-like [Homarus americanus]|uniref:ragulator complex protein LAMTOR5-like n=1 Tax=Homarus americanus TaxID=6706 RepID=UPI001C44EE20|nr:ragulator complex protein LAMTOR5-like [Homarus americanus]